MRQIFLDTETTGLNHEAGDRIVEIGCIEMLNRRLSGRHLHHYLNPERRDSHERVLKVHGLTSEKFLADKPLFAHGGRRVSGVRRAMLKSSSTTQPSTSPFSTRSCDAWVARRFTGPWPGSPTAWPWHERFSGQGEFPRRALPTAGGRRLEPGATRCIARRGTLGRGVHPPDPRPKFTGDRLGRGTSCRPSSPGGGRFLGAGPRILVASEFEWGRGARRRCWRRSTRASGDEAVFRHTLVMA